MTERCHAECHKEYHMLSVILLSVGILNFIIPSVVTPFFSHTFQRNIMDLMLLGFRSCSYQQFCKLQPSKFYSTCLRGWFVLWILNELSLCWAKTFWLKSQQKPILLFTLSFLKKKGKNSFFVEILHWLIHWFTQCIEKWLGYR